MKKFLTIFTILLLSSCSFFNKTENEKINNSGNLIEIIEENSDFLDENNSGTITEEETNTGTITEEETNTGENIEETRKISKEDILKMYEKNVRNDYHRSNDNDDVVTNDDYHFNDDIVGNDYYHSNGSNDSNHSNNNDWINFNEKENISENKFFITKLETAGEKIDNQYEISINLDTENIILPKDIFSQDYNFSFLINLQTENNYDKAIYISHLGDKIEGKKQGKNFTFEINELTNLPTYENEGIIELYVGEEITRKDKVRATNDNTQILKLAKKYDENTIEIYEEGNNKYQEEADYYFIIRIYKDLKIHMEDIPVGPGSTDYDISYFGDYLVILYTTTGCGIDNNTQIIVDKNWNKIENLKLENIPTSVTIGNTKYYFDEENIDFTFRDWSGLLGYSQENIGVMSKDIFKMEDSTQIFTFESLETKESIRVRLPKNVYFKWTDYPVIIPYKIENIETPSDSFMFLEIPETYKDLIPADGKITDIDLTKFALGNYLDEKAGYGRLEGLSNSENRDIIDGKIVITEADLPIINLYKVYPEDNLYSLSLYEPYELVSFAEMCKPAIYIYTPTSQKQSVEIKPTNQMSYFTKLIPNFDSKNTWTYQTNPEKGNIIGTDKNEYDYLYYSVAVPNYEFNTDGWQVKGSDIEKFFEDKLEKIGFNEKEKSDFIEYWLEMYEDKDTYYFVSFKYNEEIDKYVELNFNKKPNSQFRVLLESYKLSESQEKNYFKYENVGDKFDKYLIQKADRNPDFDVFEWGGVFYDKDDLIYIVY